MPIKVKICGIKSKAAARAAAKFGADFIGFNFVPSSKRKIRPKSAQKIISNLSEGKQSRAVSVGVFMNQSELDIKRVLSQVKLTMLQFHGNESPEFCASFKLPYIKSFSIGKNTSVQNLAKQMKKYKAKYFLLDRAVQGKGPAVDLAKVRLLSKRFLVILAGGLMPANIQKVIAGSGNIIGVDVAGGVETKGKKDLKKIKRFAALVKLSPRT